MSDGIDSRVLIKVVGGPAHGKKLERPHSDITTISVPVFSKTGVELFQYTVRRCRNASGDTVELLSPAGQQIDPSHLKLNGLTN